MDFRSETTWTDADISLLAEMYFTSPRTPTGIMADRLGRSIPSVWAEISRLGMSQPGAKLRTCLPCNREFFSTHIGNRICNWCVRVHQLECA